MVSHVLQDYLADKQTHLPGDWPGRAENDALLLATGGVGSSTL